MTDQRGSKRVEALPTLLSPNHIVWILDGRQVPAECLLFESVTICYHRWTLGRSLPFSVSFIARSTHRYLTELAAKTRAVDEKAISQRMATVTDNPGRCPLVKDRNSIHPP